METLEAEVDLGIGYTEMLVIIVIALIVLGPDKLPEVGKFLGKSLRALRSIQDDFSLRMRENMRDEWKNQRKNSLPAKEPISELNLDRSPHEPESKPE